jgi:hypothetical protein
MLIIISLAAVLNQNRIGSDSKTIRSGCKSEPHRSGFQNYQKWSAADSFEPINSSPPHDVSLFIVKLSKSPPLSTSSVSSAAVDVTRAGLLRRRHRSTVRARRPPPLPLYHAHRPPPPPPSPHRGKIKVMYVGIFHHVCRSIDAIYVGNADRSSRSE